MLEKVGNIRNLCKKSKSEKETLQTAQLREEKENRVREEGNMRVYDGCESHKRHGSCKGNKTQKERETLTK